MIRTLAIAAALLVSTACTRHAAAPATTVLLVRHAEKAKDGGRDPALTEAGRARAEALAVALGGSGISAIYSTPFARTQTTAAPTATALSIPVSISKVEAGFTEALARQILSAHRGETVLVVGHSNTLGPTLQALGAGPTFELDASRYGDLFVCTIPADGPPSVVRLMLQPW